MLASRKNPRVDVSKSHASRKNKLQSNKASRMVTQAYCNLAMVYVYSRSCEKKREVLYGATLSYVNSSNTTLTLTLILTLILTLTE